MAEETAHMRKYRDSAIWENPACDHDPFGHLDLTGIDMDAVAREANEHVANDKVFQERIARFNPGAAAIHRAPWTVID